MATSRGAGDVRDFIARLPAELERRVLRGAARAGGAVVLAEAKERVGSADVREALAMRARTQPGQVVVRITVPDGWARSLGIWLEYGTKPHFISVDESQRGGRGIGRINKQLTEAGGNHSLVINGKFVGETIRHPGARPHPFLRVSLDVKEREAVAAAQAYINSRIAPSGIVGSDEAEVDDA